MRGIERASERAACAPQKTMQTAAYVQAGRQGTSQYVANPICVARSANDDGAASYHHKCLSLSLRVRCNLPATGAPILFHDVSNTSPSVSSLYHCVITAT